MMALAAIANPAKIAMRMTIQTRYDIRETRRDRRSAASLRTWSRSVATAWNADSHVL
jgi:hypothetical protein